MLNDRRYLSSAFVSARIFQDPSACFLHTITSWPFSVLGFPSLSVV